MLPDTYSHAPYQQCTWSGMCWQQILLCTIDWLQHLEAWHSWIHCRGMACTLHMETGCQKRQNYLERERRTREGVRITCSKGWTRFCGRHSWTAEGMQPHFMENSHTQLSVVLQVCAQGHRRRTIRGPVFYNGRVCLFWGLGQRPSRLTHFPSFIRTLNSTCKNDIQVRA